MTRQAACFSLKERSATVDYERHKTVGFSTSIHTTLVLRTTEGSTSVGEREREREKYSFFFQRLILVEQPHAYTS